MIPLSLRLRNFMSYRDMAEPLSFDGIHVAVLAGDNGHGKSALLDAITWALWGRARAKLVDDLIHQGATEMEVELEFALDEQLYRVIRKRQRRGRTSQAVLEFAIRSENGYRPLTERSVAETDRAIETTLGMSYETFVNSSFIQQGKADSFTLHAPGERKKILADILELGEYDVLEQRAREARDERAGRLTLERQEAERYARELQELPTLQEELRALDEQLAVLEERVREREQAAQAARERVARLAEAREHLTRVRAQWDEDRAEHQRTELTLADLKRRLGEAEAVLQDAGRIEQAVRDLAATRRELADLDRRHERLVALEKTRQEAQARLDQERVKLETRERGLKGQLPRLEQLSTLDASVAADLERASKRRDELGQLEASRAALQQRVHEASLEEGEKRSRNQHLKEEMQKLRGEIDRIATLTTCPVCLQEVGAEHRGRVRAELERKGLELRDQFRDQEREYRTIQEQREQQQAQLSAMDQRLAERAAVERQVTTLQERLRQAEEAARDLAEVRRELTEVSALLQHQAYAPEERRQVAAAVKAVAALGYDEGCREAARKRVDELAWAEGRERELGIARASAELLRQQREGALEHLERLAASSQRHADEARKLEIASAGYEGEKAQLDCLDAELRESRAERDDVLGRRNDKDARVRYCLQLEKMRQESLERQDTLMRERSIFASLAEAFGRRGVQAMLIETALPDLEEEANRLLGRMTDGRMSVRFETQREAQSRDGVIETLDIKISDELGTRSYELFSGGESFRVNFAIRVALSRLLAQRAGTPLQLLVIDEGFGSQDQEGRDRVVECIQAIQDEFKKILVITHLEELRERFPVRIDVQKTAQGSVVSVR